MPETFRVKFVGGQYDGADFTFTDRLPEQIELTADVVGGNINDPSFKEVIETNLAPSDRDGMIVIRHAESIRHKYELVTDDEGVPSYRYLSWSVIGGTNKDRVR